MFDLNSNISDSRATFFCSILCEEQERSIYHKHMHSLVSFFICYCNIADHYIIIQVRHFVKYTRIRVLPGQYFIRTKSYFPIYGNMPVIENSYSGIFYAVRVTCRLLQKQKTAHFEDLFIKPLATFSGDSYGSTQ